MDRSDPALPPGGHVERAGAIKSMIEVWTDILVLFTADRRLRVATPAKKSATSSKAAARRKSRTRPSKSATTRSSSGTFTCPECGKTFNRPASLGAHRNRAHGVAGISAGAVSSRKATTRGRGRKTSSTRGPAQRRSIAGRTPTRRSASTRDALLGMLFPRGIPANVQTVQRVNAWLDEAESLALLG